ncbi:MAG: hypothetical protein U0X39_07710 [Bacteroidales bacterium]
MKTEDERLEAIIKLLRDSKPEPPDASRMASDVIRMIRRKEERYGAGRTMLNLLFGWTEIVWVRSSLALASVMLLLFFSFEQLQLMKRIDNLEVRKYGEINQFTGGNSPTSRDGVGLYRFMTGGTGAGANKISEKDIDEFVKSVDRLQTDYKDILVLIERDPRMKKYVEDRLEEIRKKSSKL